MLLLPTAAQAQVGPNPQLSGAVHFDTAPGCMRITRAKSEALSGSADQQHSYGFEQEPRFDNVIDPSAFTGGTVSRSAGAQISQSAPSPQPPFIWYQCAEGGYYDGSGHTADRVWANQLYKYGGKFNDGTPVPKEPITQFNSSGHAFRTAQTDTNNFWFR